MPGPCLPSRKQEEVTVTLEPTSVTGLPSRGREDDQPPPKVTMTLGSPSHREDAAT